MKTLLALLSLTLVAVTVLPTTTANSIDPIFPKCVVASDQRDMGEKVCVDPRDASCSVYEVRTTFLGTEKHCLYPTSSCDPCGPPPAAASQAGVNCLPMYSRTNVGTYSIVRRNSCAPPEAYSCPYENAPISQCENLLSAQVKSSSRQQCLEYYSDWSIGPVHHHQTDSCNAQNYVCEQTASDVLGGGFDASKCNLGLA